MPDETVNAKLVVTDKIGIGIEKPNAQLDIFSSTAPSQIFLESGGALLKLSVDASGAAIGTDNAFPLSIKTDDISRISIDKVGNISFSGALSVQNSLTVSGNVGIGTTSPSYKLAIAAGDINIDDGRALRQAGRWVIGGDSNVLSIGSSNAPDGRDIKFDPGFAGALTIKKDTGNVGIGTTNPTCKLEVAGDIKASSIHSKPKVFSFKVEGDFDKFYPVVFYDDNWGDGPTELEINRTSVHIDSEWRGSLNSRFTFHSSAWGNGANFCRSEIYYSQKPFIAAYKNYHFSNYFIVWLRGGGTTYFWRASSFISLGDYSAKEKIIKVNDDPQTTETCPVKINIDSNIQSSGICLDQNFIVNGNIGIGTTSPTEKLHVTGGGIKVGATTIATPGIEVVREVLPLALDTEGSFIDTNSNREWTPITRTIYGIHQSTTPLPGSQRKYKLVIRNGNNGIGQNGHISRYRLFFTWANQPDNKEYEGNLYWGSVNEGSWDTITLDHLANPSGQISYWRLEGYTSGCINRIFNVTIQVVDVIQ